MDDFKSVRMPLAWLLHVAPRLQPRLFSISSSPLAHPGQIHATVSVVEWRTHYGRARLGLCSNLLAEQQPGASLALWLTKGTMRLPPPETPIVLVCTGSGVAPFRSFVHERMAQRAAAAGSGGAAGQQQKAMAPTLVFFGCRRRAHDFLYESEWAHFQDCGLLAGDTHGMSGGGFVPAFSRDTPSQPASAAAESTTTTAAAKDYVTHRIRAEGRRVWGLIAAGAHVFVAGSTGKMPEDVLDAFAHVACAEGGMDAAEAKRFLARMDATGRYSVEAW
mmetsp:Transcript_7666/g.19525  ORF Transcript_7666/g.19525 Transcript_7666/m.19525 type:complete len:276 (+) Transcript_7666:273-1100(+)